MANTLFKKIYLSSLNFLAPLTPEKTYATIVKEATKLVGAQWGSVLLEQDGRLHRVYSSLPPAEQIKHRKKGFLYKAFKLGKPTVLRIKDIVKVHPEIKNLGVASDVIIPLKYRNKSIGILAVLSNEKEQLNDEEMNTLVLFGSMASLAIQKALLYDVTQKSLEARDFFISAAAHEIKTPVTTIFGYAQLLYENKKKGQQVKPEWIDSLHSECHRLRSLINDFLEVSRIAIGRMQYYLKEYNLETIVKRALNNFAFNYPQRKLVFQSSLKAKENLIIGDPDRLIQALTNLLDNAAKFSGDDTKIAVSLKSDEAEYVVSVYDKGRGIAKKDLQRIFERYFQANASQQGLGLGLFLVKSIIDQHHGTIRLRSRVNKGTTVEVRLPKTKL